MTTLIFALTDTVCILGLEDPPLPQQRAAVSLHTGLYSSAHVDGLRITRVSTPECYALCESPYSAGRILRHWERSNITAHLLDQKVDGESLRLSSKVCKDTSRTLGSILRTSGQFKVT